MPQRQGGKSDLERARELVRILEAQMPNRMPAPPNDVFGEAFDRRLSEGRNGGREIHTFPLHLRTWFDTLSADDVGKLERLISLDSRTVQWITDKNERELKSLDGAVEFINSSRTAARVLMWCCGTAVAFVGGVVALAKNGIDFFAIIRGGK